MHWKAPMRWNFACLFSFTFYKNNIIYRTLNLFHRRGGVFYVELWPPDHWFIFWNPSPPSERELIWEEGCRRCHYLRRGHTGGELWLDIDTQREQHHVGFYQPRNYKKLGEKPRTDPTLTSEEVNHCQCLDLRLVASEVWDNKFLFKFLVCMEALSK